MRAEAQSGSAAAHVQASRAPLRPDDRDRKVIVRRHRDAPELRPAQMRRDEALRPPPRSDPDGPADAAQPRDVRLLDWVRVAQAFAPAKELPVTHTQSVTDVQTVLYG